MDSMSNTLVHLPELTVQLIEKPTLQTPLRSAASIHRKVFAISKEQMNPNFDNADLRVASLPRTS
jgi:hypothetical protein